MHPEGPATGHLDTSSFSLFFPVFKQGLKYFTVQDAASACFRRKLSRYGFINFNPVTPKYKVVNLNSQIMHFSINEKLTFCHPLHPPNAVTCLRLHPLSINTILLTASREAKPAKLLTQ